jgi:hypothetical protein
MTDKPIAWGMPRPDGTILDCITPAEHARCEGGYTVPLYAAPQPKAEPTYPLPDDLYPGSKDWVHGSYAERVQWLHMMYEAGKEQLELYAAPQPRKRLTDEELRQCAEAMDAEPLAEGWPELEKFARAIEAAVWGETK